MKGSEWKKVIRNAEGTQNEQEWENIVTEFPLYSLVEKFPTERIFAHYATTKEQ